MDYRNYDPENDRDAARRILREVGWLEKGKEEPSDFMIGAGRALVVDIRGEPECLVTTVPGTLRYLAETLPFSAITSVATSRIARKQGFASRLTARAIVADVADGALAVGLSMFDQGFYNKLGFGTGTYEHWVSFDPATLKIESKMRSPHRITIDDWKTVHASRLARMQGHAACCLLPPEITHAEMLWTSNGFGLGYYDGPNGELTHHVWASTKGEHGPDSVYWLSYQTYDQLLELMVSLKSLGDQVHLVRMKEPPGIQLQDLLVEPFKQRRVSAQAKLESRMRASAYWQIRICDLEQCLARTHLLGDTVHFNLTLQDPIERLLEGNAPWRGVGGEYVVTLGPHSGAECGTDASLPTLTASVGAFTRLWLGVRPATSLAVTDTIAGPQELLNRLDWALRLPEPKVDWDF
jgi:GNAT superfamily N-acetyltransferase